ncbi:hypothetical protein [Vulcanisaeta sp. JCM 14467]|nr:hypothetical protein [Vulcanisaeta sp. JCM 14467]
MRLSQEEKERSLKALGEDCAFKYAVMDCRYPRVIEGIRRS